MGALTAPAARGAGEPLPVLVLTGFLGSGKTSLLNHLLGGSPGLRIAAVVNDFGEIDVDASAVAGRVDSLISLANGCLCCEVDASELSDALVALSDPEAGLDLAVIEASGLAEPAVLARMVHDAPRDRVGYAGMVQVVDAENLPETLRHHPGLGAHLAGADLVVVNKCDLVGRDGWAAIRDLVRGYAPRVAIQPAVRGAVPAELLLGGVGDAVPAGRGGGHDGHDHGGHDHGHGHEGHEHLHDAYSAVTLRPSGPLHPRRLLAALSAPPPGTYRVKGSVTLAGPDGPRRYDVALVGRRLELRAGPSAPEDGLVAIGVDLPPDAAGFLDDARCGAAEEVSEQDLFGLHPYLVADGDASDVEEWIYDEDRSAPPAPGAGMLDDPEDPDAEDPAFTP